MKLAFRDLFDSVEWEIPYLSKSMVGLVDLVNTFENLRSILPSGSIAIYLVKIL